MEDLPFRVWIWVKRRCWSRTPVGVVQKLGADGAVRHGSLRTATDTSADQGRTGVVGFKTVHLRLRVPSSGRRSDVSTTLDRFSWRSSTLAGCSRRPTSTTLAGRSHTADTFAIVDCCEREATVRAAVVAKGFWPWRRRTLSRHYSWLGTVGLSIHEYTCVYNIVK